VTRLQNFLKEQISDFVPKEERNIKRHFNELKKLSFLTFEDFCNKFNSLYHAEKIRLVPDNILEMETDFWKNGTIDIHLPIQTEIPELNIKNQFWKKIVRLTAKTREKAIIIGRMEEFQFVVHIPIKQHLKDQLKSNAYEAFIEERDDKYSPTKSIYYDIFGNSETYKEFVKLINKYKNNEIEIPSDKRFF